ncbi:MAG: hypothetical protein A3K66_00875 [Euryarchaeota archaeon RBG_16_67_27]|nr:MAG: hypothetical protein A3K66_00875 [Euryarchaeota archaeon RBG_16_67_27]
MRRKDILRRLEERLARGEISEGTYIDIKARYESEPEEPEEAMPPADASFQESIAQVTEDATRAAGEAVRAAGEAIRAVDFSGLGVRLSDEVIKIAGAGTVTGQPVRTREFKAAGSARVQGDLEAVEAKVAGACAFEGNVRVTELRASGSTQINGSLDAHEVESSGSLRVAKDVNAHEVMTSGSLRVGGKVKVHEFHSSGSVRIEGELEADEVLIELGGTSYVKSIRAQEIQVKGTGGFLRPRGELTVETIESDEVYLEGTEANLVRGNEVRVGPHCRIRTVEARELVVHESSEVQERKVPPS